MYLLMSPFQSPPRLKLIWLVRPVEPRKRRAQGRE
jgi:hypothetical protein